MLLTLKYRKRHQTSQSTTIIALIIYNISVILSPKCFFWSDCGAKMVVCVKKLTLSKLFHSLRESGESMKKVYGAAGILKQGNRICAVRRKFGDFAGYYEFPGGKVEPGETAEQAVIRECKEELDVDVEILHLVTVIEHDYPGFHLTMPLFLCEIVGGSLTLSVHDDLVWLDEENIAQLNWIEATKNLVPKIKEIMLTQMKEG